MAKVENTEGNMINSDLKALLENGGKREPVTEFSGRIITLEMEKARDLHKGFIENNIKEYTAYANGGPDDKPPRWMGPRFGEAKRNIPDFSRAKGKTIAKAYAHDYNQLAAALDADKEGYLAKVVRPDGGAEQGIVDTDGGRMTREGQWVSRDKQGRIRQIANFTEGKADGPAYAYDEEGKLRESGLYRDGKPVAKHNSYDAQGQRVHETVYNDEGQVQSERPIDPAMEAQKRDAKKAQRTAVKAIGMRR